MSHRNIGKYFFSLRVVGKWNDIGDEMVEEGSIYSFKSRYDRTHEAKRE